MLIIFKSKAAGDVIMFGDVAQQLLGIMGKQPDKQGILTVEQLPDAIARLRQAAIQNKTQKSEGNEPKLEKTLTGDQRPFVSLAQRAVPLIELLEHARKAKVPVTWGVS